MQLLNSLLYMLGAMSPYILLGFLIAGILHAFIPQQTMARHLSGTGWRPVVKAAMIGIPLPLCSCGVLPTAIAMRRAGASRASSTSFLLATPQTGVDSIAATWSLLGPAFAIVRPVAALFTALAGGLAVGAGEKSEEPSQADHADASHGDNAVKKSFGEKCIDALRYGFVDLVSSIGGWLVAGLIIAALITVYVPEGAFTLLGRWPLMSMLVVLVVAIPMYVCATGSIPIAMSLVMKGLSPGTALVLLMAGPAVNFASCALVSREMGRRAALTYLASIIVGSILFGLAIDYLMPASWFDLPAGIHAAHSSASHFDFFTTSCTILLAVLLIFSFFRRHHHNHNHITTNEMSKQYIIKGMNCPHCQAAVTKSILAVEGVNQVDVNLTTGKAIVDGSPSDEAIARAVRAAGFDIEK